MVLSSLANVFLGATSGSLLLFFLAAVALLTNWDINSRGRIYLILALIAGVFVLQTLIFYHFTVDDVYISLRYARNLANGHGLVFNTDGSPPVEGYTNFLWVLMESSLYLMGLDDIRIIDTIRITGLAFGIGILIITFLLIRLLTNDNRISLIGVLFLSAVPELALWSVGGLETSMYIFWMLAGIYRYLLEKRDGKPHILSFVFITLMALTRPEGLFFALAIIGSDLALILVEEKENPVVRTQKIKQVLYGALTFIILYGAYFIWRYSFYGHLFPNTFYAKKMTYAGQFIYRIKQMSGFIVNLFPLFAIACYGYFYFHKKNSIANIRLLIMLLLLIVFCLAARNEWMPGYRYELPFVPLLMIFFAIGINRMLFNGNAGYSMIWQNRITRFGTLCFLGLYLLYHFNDLRKKGDEFTSQLNRAHIPLGKWLKKHAPQNASYASWDMGAVPYYSELPQIIDINSEGLLNPQTTLRGYDVDYLLSLNPSFLVLPPNTSYVRPRVILDFYSREKLNKEYEFLFSMSFSKDYLLNVYRHRNTVLSDDALNEGKKMALKSREGLD